MSSTVNKKISLVSNKEVIVMDHYIEPFKIVIEPGTLKINIDIQE